MPNLPWVLAVSITLGAGPLAALDLPWPWWTPSSADAERRGNYSFQFDSENPGEEEKLASEGPSQEARPEGWAHFWGYSVFHYDVHSWIGPGWFSTPLQTGTLSSAGGWGLYFLDSFGVFACGEFWPLVAWGILAILLIITGLALLYLLLVFCRPCWSLCQCCCRQTRAVANEVGELLPELQLGGTYEKLEIKGPASRSGVESEFYQRQVKGRGSERKPNDVIVFTEGQVSRLKVDCDHWARVDRHGLWVRMREVKGSTSRVARQKLELEGRIHLCRDQHCPLEQQPTPGLHCKAYAVVDANSLVDLGAYAGWSTRRVVVLCARLTRWFWTGLWTICLCTSGWFVWRRLWRGDVPSRLIQEGSTVRALDPESESEAEVVEDPCEAVLVGLEHGGKPRALTTDPCQDKASGGGVRLLERDRELSDIKRRASVRLCDHHRQLYVAACSGRKCSVLSCYETIEGARQGVPLCRQHLLEVGGGIRPPRKVSWHEDPESAHATDSSLPEEEKVPLKNSGPSPKAKSSLSSPKRRRPASSEPQSSIQRRIEGQLEQGPCLVLVRPKCLQRPSEVPRWLAFLGSVEGFSQAGRNQERVDIHLPGLKTKATVVCESVLPPPADNGAGKISKNWVQNFLRHSHDDEAGRGISVLASRITEDQAAVLNTWEGEITSGDPIWTKREEAQWASRPVREILPHSEAYLQEPMKSVGELDFMTPPRPEKKNATSRDWPPVPAFPDVQEDECQAALEDAKLAVLQHDAKDLDEETLQTIASAFGVEPDQLTKDFKPPAAKRPQVLSPPGLGDPSADLLMGQISVEKSTGSGEVLTEGCAENRPANSLLVQPATTRPANPLLKIMPGRETGASLFPKNNGGGRGLIKPAHNNPLTEGRVGATYAEALGDGSQSQSADRIIHAIDGLRKAQDDDKNLTKGSLSSIREAEKMDVYLARGCGTLTIEVAPGVYGKELFHAGKRVAQHARHMLHLIKWPVLMTNRVLLAIAGLWWGGKESYTLHASDCITARSEQLDSWTPSSDNKLEPRNRPPGVFNTWLRYAENSIRVFGACYGVEHVQERVACLQALKEAHEEDEHAFPASYCIELFEELVAAWCEELRESRRKLCAALGTENPRLEDLKLYALAPGKDGTANFQFPRIWDLSDPEGYYQSVVVPRQQRQMSRLLHKQLHDHNLKQKKTAGMSDLPDENADKSGKAPKLNLKEEEAGGAALVGKGAYPAGKRLTPAEASRSIEHAPKDPKTSKPICWDAATHMGCPKGAKCQHAHEPLPGLAKLDYSVAMQVIRRGGLKGGPKIDPKEVDGRIAQLRAQAAAEKLEKMQQPKAKAQAKPKGKTKASRQSGSEPGEEDKAGDTQWAVPADYQVPLTRMEDDLQEAVKGPDLSWLELPPQECEEEGSPPDSELSTQELDRMQRWQKLLANGLFAQLHDPSDYLQSHVVARILAAEDVGERLDLIACLETAAEHGHPALAEEACRHLEALKYEPKAGHRADAEFTPPSWSEGVGVGELRLDAEFGIPPIPYVDYQDKLSVVETGVPTGDGQEFEERQCLPLHVGIGLAKAFDPTVSEEKARKSAAQLRHTLWEEAASAHAHLGDPPAWITETEHFLRQNVHDCVYPHHEKDYRTLQTLAGDSLRGTTLVVVRLSYFGRLEADLLHGSGADSERLVIVTIHRGHMRLLQPRDPHAFLSKLRERSKITRELATEPWQESLDRGQVEDILVPAKLPTCTRCAQQQKRPYRVGQSTPKPPASLGDCFHTHPALPAPSLQHRLSFAYGPLGQEVSMGGGGWTQGLTYQGIPCAMQVAEHSVQQQEVQARLKGLAGAVPGPEVPNVWHLSISGLSFCDDQVLKGGTRTWEKVEGDGSRPLEVEDNAGVAFLADLCHVLEANGRLFCIEGDSPTGRYPKLWDLPCMQQLRSQTGARIIPFTTGASPHRSWWLVSQELYPWALLMLARAGSSQLAPCPTSLHSAARRYAPAVCAAWGLVVKAAYEDWDWQTYIAEHHSLRALAHVWADLPPAAPACATCDAGGDGSTGGAVQIQVQTLIPFASRSRRLEES